MTGRLRALLACLATAALVLPLGWMWWSSLLPDEYSVHDMGYVDLGGGPPPATMVSHAGTHSAGHGGGRSVADLRAETDARADVRVRLVAAKETFELASGRTVDGYTLNGRSPGPTIEATQGDLVEVQVENASVPDGVAVHWHGIDVPNAMDGVAGVTQDAIGPGERFRYRFRAEQAGTYWYHSHQVSHEQVEGGLLGAVVVTPKDTDPAVVDVPALVHTYDGVRTVNGQQGDVSVDVVPGSTARVRVVNTDNGPMSVWVGGAGYRVLAVDGTDVHGPTRVSGRAVLVTAGARVDLEVVVPDGGARVELGGSAALLLGAAATALPEQSAPAGYVDLLTYGSSAALGFDPAHADRRFEYVVGRRPGFLDGRPGMWWTVNGHRYPDVPMYTVTDGDVVRMRIENRSGEVHPMHLHGHHAVVLSRDGEPATGSPWWVDSLNVGADETYEIAFVADNPGIWMDHCHNLPHAAQGLVAHLMYAGVTTPFRIGGTARNEPE